MKRVFAKLAILLVVLTTVVSSFGGCIDTDELITDLGLYEDNKNMNNRFEVLLRTCQGVTCYDDDLLRKVYKGESTVFRISIADDFIYLGNSAGVPYNGGALKIEDVKAPLTVDIYALYKRDVYYVELASVQNVAVSIKEGEEWSYTPHSVTLEVIVPEGYKFLCWTDGREWVSGASYIGLSETCTVEIKEKGIHTIYANVIREEDYYPDML